MKAFIKKLIEATITHPDLLTVAFMLGLAIGCIIVLFLHFGNIKELIP